MESKSRSKVEALRKFNDERKFIAIMEAQIDAANDRIMDHLAQLMEPYIREFAVTVTDEEFELVFYPCLDSLGNTHVEDNGHLKITKEQILLVEFFWVPKENYADENVKRDFSDEQLKCIKTAMRKFKTRVGMTVRGIFPEAQTKRYDFEHKA